VGARLLFVGDVHLGRRPGSLPEDPGALGLDPAELGTAAAWRTAVALAREGGAHAVVLAGDVVESAEDRFEAYAPLAQGVRELVDAGIPVFAVAGNHDVEALPRLADQIGGFTLLGRGGAWEGAELATPGGDRVRLLGWSFPERRVHTDPVAELPPELAAPQPELATLGVLHCDLDAGASPYAPVPRSALERVPVDAWLLGHVHAPGLLSEARPIGYLGSLVGLDPGEPGPRGPWWVEVEGPGRVRARQVPAAPLRWEREDVSLAEVEGSDREARADALFAALRRGLERVRDRLAAEGARARLVGCRLRLVGRSPHHRELRALADDPTRWPRESWEGVAFFVERVVDEGSPALDLERLAAGSDPPALVARRLLALERGGEEAERLVREAGRRLAQASAEPRFSGLEAEPPDPPGIHRLLVGAATRLLEDLVAQRAPEEGAP
jgi:exonuclease SbcD